MKIVLGICILIWVLLTWIWWWQGVSVEEDAHALWIAPVVAAIFSFQVYAVCYAINLFR